MIEKVTVPDGKNGQWKVERKHIKPSPVDDLRMMMQGRYVPEGDYTFLTCGRNVVMSDTPDEMNDHNEAVRRAVGRCLVAGLGLGMVVNAMCAKPEVEKVIVIEKSEEVISLIAPYYAAKYPEKLEVIHADISNGSQSGVRFST